MPNNDDDDDDDAKTNFLKVTSKKTLGKDANTIPIFPQFTTKHTG